MYSVSTAEVKLMVMEVAVLSPTCSQAVGPFETVPPV